MNTPMKTVKIISTMIAGILVAVVIMWAAKELILASVPIVVIVIGCTTAVILFTTTAVVTAKVIDGILKSTRKTHVQ